MPILPEGTNTEIQILKFIMEYKGKNLYNLFKNYNAFVFVMSLHVFNNPGGMLVPDQ